VDDIKEVCDSLEGNGFSDIALIVNFKLNAYRGLSSAKDLADAVETALSENRELSAVKLLGRKGDLIETSIAVSKEGMAANYNSNDSLCKSTGFGPAAPSARSRRSASGQLEAQRKDLAVPVGGMESFIKGNFGQKIEIAGILELLKSVGYYDRRTLGENEVEGTVYIRQSVNQDGVSVISPVVYLGNVFSGFDEAASGSEDFNNFVADLRARPPSSVADMRKRLSEELGINTERVSDEIVEREFPLILYLKQKGDELLKKSGLTPLAREDGRPMKVAFMTYPYGNRTVYLPVGATVARLPDGEARHYWGYPEDNELKKMRSAVGARGAVLEKGVALQFKGAGTPSYNGHFRRMSFNVPEEGLEKRLRAYSLSKHVDGRRHSRPKKSDETKLMEKISEHSRLLAEQFLGQEQGKRFVKSLSEMTTAVGHSYQIMPDAEQLKVFKTVRMVEGAGEIEEYNIK
jgi:hypothetical protein